MGFFVGVNTSNVLGGAAHEEEWDTEKPRDGKEHDGESRDGFKR